MHVLWNPSIAPRLRAVAVSSILLDLLRPQLSVTEVGGLYAAGCAWSGVYTKAPKRTTVSADIYIS